MGKSAAYYREYRKRRKAAGNPIGGATTNSIPRLRNSRRETQPRTQPAQPAQSELNSKYGKYQSNYANTPAIEPATPQPIVKSNSPPPRARIGWAETIQHFMRDNEGTIRRVASQVDTTPRPRVAKHAPRPVPAPAPETEAEEIPEVFDAEEVWELEPLEEVEALA